MVVQGLQPCCTDVIKPPVRNLKTVAVFKFRRPLVCPPQQTHLGKSSDARIPNSATWEASVFAPVQLTIVLRKFEWQLWEGISFFIGNWSPPTAANVADNGHGSLECRRLKST